MKKILTLIAATAIALLAISCQPTVKTVANTYQGKEVTFDFAPHTTITDTAVGIAQAFANAQISNVYVVLGEDGTAEVKLSPEGKAEKGTWFLNDDQIKITIADVSLEGKVKGNTLTFPLPVDDFEEMIKDLELEYLTATVVLVKK